MVLTALNWVIVIHVCYYDITTDVPLSNTGFSLRNKKPCEVEKSVKLENILIIHKSLRDFKQEGGVSESTVVLSM